MALNNENNNDCCKCTTPEYELILNEQGPQGRQGKKGEAGFAPIISVKDNTDSNYTLNILTQDGQITTPNLKANLPAGGATGQVLTKNSANQDDCSWQNLPNATTEVEGIARLATEEDFETTEDSSVSYTTIVTPALFNSEFEKQSANLVTTDTQQYILAPKTFWNGIGVYNNLTVGYNSSSQNGKIVTNVRVNDVRIPIVEPYDTHGSFRIGAVKEEASTNIQNGFDINNNLFDGTQGVTYYEQGQKGKLIADFNIDKYIQAGENITINKTEEGKLTINSVGGGSGTSDYTQLTNKPQINGHELTGNQDGTTLGLANEQEVGELGNELSELANTVTNKQDKLTAGDGITINNNVISVNEDIPIPQNIDVKSINVLQYNRTSNVKIDGTINNVEPFGIFVSGVKLPSGRPLPRTKLITASDFDTNNFTYDTHTGTISLKNSEGTKYVVQTDYATTTTGGTVKIDGTTITIKDGVISAAVSTLDLQAAREEINNVSKALNGFKFVETSEKQYNASDAHDANTLYIITS